MLDALPKRVQPQAKRMLHEIVEAATRNDASRAIDGFVAEFEPKWPKAAVKLTKDRDSLLAFYDFPAEHWRHLRSTKPDRELVRDGQAAHPGDQGRGSKDAALAMAYKLLDDAQDRWRMINGAEGSESYSTERRSRTESRSPTTNHDRREGRRLILLRRPIHNS